ncbi:MAG: ABC transporter permease [Rhodothermales bacterium]
MLHNYLRIALRTLRQQKGYTLINVGGLALGLACTFLIVVHIQHELSYDTFHAQSEDLYRLIRERTNGAETWRQANTTAGITPEVLDLGLPEIQHIARIDDRNPYFYTEGQVHNVHGVMYVDAAFLDMFSFELQRGTPTTVLRDPFSIIVTKSEASKLFGTADPMGKVISYNNRFDLTVTGVMADPPVNSHLEFKYIVPFELITQIMGQDELTSHDNGNYFTYVQLAPSSDPGAVQQKLDAWGAERFGAQGTSTKYILQPLEEIHLTTDLQWDMGGHVDPQYLLMLGLIGVFILFIACVNFMNLATARAAKRAKEVGVRKSLGAGRKQLIGQFLGESMLLSLVAIVMAMGLVVVALPFFNEVINGTAAFEASNWGLVLILVTVGLSAGLIAGSYPAFYLSAFHPSAVLKGKATQGRSAVRFRKVLIVTQFGISIVLIMCTMTVFNQLDYLREQSLGFDKEQVVFLPITSPIRDSYDVLRNTLEQSPRIQSVSMAGGLPGRVNTNRGYNWPGATAEAEENGRSLYTMIADPDLIETLGLELIEGRTFSWDRPADAHDTYILNESAAELLGYDLAVNQPFRAWDREMGQVIGVVKDFHFQSLHQEVQPLVINYKPNWLGTIAIRLAPGDPALAIADVKQAWAEYAPGYPVDYRFLDEDFDRLYRTENELKSLFGFFAGIAIFVACLGLFGLASYSAERRTKEIGVRKVLGASVQSMVVLMTKEFIQLVLIAFVVAAPLAYWLMSDWLNDFAYRVSMGLGTLALTALLALGVAWLTVAYQAFKAAHSDPIHALRYE